MKNASRRNAAPGASIRLAGGEASFDPRRIVWTRHSLAEHPLLQSPFKPLVEADAGRTVAEAFENIHLPGTRIAFYNLDELPEYRALLERWAS